jgi:hypothetical protein
MEDFGKEMEAKEKQGFVTQKLSSLDINGMFIKPSQKSQHAIRMYQNGKSYTVYINGNPAVSRAVNGQNIVPPSEFAQYISGVTRFVERDIKSGNRKNAGDHLLDAIGSCNDFAENLCRFSVYMASR